MRGRCVARELESRACGILAFNLLPTFLDKHVVNRTFATPIPEFNSGIEVQFSAGIRWFDAALLGAAAFFSFGIATAIALAPKTGSAGIAVIFAPWTNARDAISQSARAGGRFVRFGAFDFIAVIQPESESFSRNVRVQGAWFIADPSALAACLKPFARNKI